MKNSRVYGGGAKKAFFAAPSSEWEAGGAPRAEEGTETCEWGRRRERKIQHPHIQTHTQDISKPYQKRFFFA